MKSENRYLILHLKNFVNLPVIMVATYSVYLIF